MSNGEQTPETKTSKLAQDVKKLEEIDAKLSICVVEVRRIVKSLVGLEENKPSEAEKEIHPQSDVSTNINRICGSMERNINIITKLVHRL